MSEYSKVYHGSSKQGMKLIEVREGTHRKEWIYAAKDPVYCALFIVNKRLGDFGYIKGLDEERGKMFVCERFSGAFDQLYEGTKGSIYILPGKTFKSTLECFDEEVISEVSVTPEKEIVIDNIKEYLLNLQKENKLDIYFYPSRPHFVPEDDEDIVMKAVIWAKQFGERTFNALKEMLPHLEERSRLIFNDKKILLEKVDEWLHRFPSHSHFVLSAMKDDFPEVWQDLSDETKRRLVEDSKRKEG